MDNSKWGYLFVGLLLGVAGSFLIMGRTIEPTARAQDVEKAQSGSRYLLSAWAFGSANNGSFGAYIVDQATGDVYVASSNSVQLIGRARK